MAAAGDHDQAPVTDVDDERLLIEHERIGLPAPVAPVPAPVAGIHRVGRGERAQLLFQIPDHCPVPALPRASAVLLSFRIQGSFFRQAPLVYCGDQLLLDEFAELVQVDIAQDRAMPINSPAFGQLRASPNAACDAASGPGSGKSI